MSSCKRTIPEPGITQINMTAQDQDESAIPYALVGLFGASDFNLYEGFPKSDCLIDTFFTNFNGFKEIDYLTDKYNFLWVSLLDHNQESNTILLDDAVETVTLISKSTEFLLSIEAQKLDYDSILVEVNPRNYSNCNMDNNELSSFLDHKKVVEQTTDFLLNAIPNSVNRIYVDNYKDGAIVADTILYIQVLDTIVDIQIN